VLGERDEPMMVGLRAPVAGTSDSMRSIAATAEELYPAGSAPGLPRRILTEDPLELDRQAPAARWILDSAAAAGYPVERIWSSLVGTVQPRVLNANGGMLEVLPASDLVYDPQRPLAIAAIAHIYYDDLAGELLDRLATLPAPYDLIVTTTDETKAEAIRALITARADPNLGRSEVRVLESNRGRDQSAFYVGCRDILLDERYDLVVKLHTKRSPQNEVTGRFFRRQQLDNLFSSPEYTSSLLALFQREPGLGLVFPPMIHSGFPTMGNAWFANRESVDAALGRLGIEPPVDDDSPLAPYGGMFIARRAALAPLAEEPWAWAEYPDGDEYADGTLAHVQERLPVLVAAARGFHARTVATREYAGMSHALLEVKLDRMSRGIHGWPADQVQSVQRRFSPEEERLTAIGRAVDGSRRDAIIFALKKVLRR
jgi:rhamnosyltransferase